MCVYEESLFLFIYKYSAKWKANEYVSTALPDANEEEEDEEQARPSPVKPPALSTLDEGQGNMHVSLCVGFFFFFLVFFFS